MLKAVAILSGTVAHYVFSMSMFMAAFGTSMDRMDTGRTATLAEQAISLFSQVLLLPLASPLVKAVPGDWFPGLWGHLPFVANSLIWGTGAILVYSGFKRAVAPQGQKA